LETSSRAFRIITTCGRSRARASDRPFSLPKMDPRSIHQKPPFSLSTKDGQTVEVVMTEPKPRTSIPVLSRAGSVPFCIEIASAHNQQFSEKAEDEILHSITELRELPHRRTVLSRERTSSGSVNKTGKCNFQSPNLCPRPGEMVYALTPQKRLSREDQRHQEVPRHSRLGGIPEPY